MRGCKPGQRVSSPGNVVVAGGGEDSRVIGRRGQCGEVEVTALTVGMEEYGEKRKCAAIVPAGSLFGPQAADQTMQGQVGKRRRNEKLGR